mmetsp:Transcript_14141/g.32904  ORF Transcript_14141/g.32904 Transcript_14141/m.32904 type:complete len:290 (-) Transcript_14141:135-1004(-)
MAVQRQSLQNRSDAGGPGIRVGARDRFRGPERSVHLRSVSLAGRGRDRPVPEHRFVSKRNRQTDGGPRVRHLPRRIPVAHGVSVRRRDPGAAALDDAVAGNLRGRARRRLDRIRIHGEGGQEQEMLGFALRLAEHEQRVDVRRRRNRLLDRTQSVLSVLPQGAQKEGSDRLGIRHPKRRRRHRERRMDSLEGLDQGQGGRRRRVPQSKMDGRVGNSGVARRRGSVIANGAQGGSPLEARAAIPIHVLEQAFPRRRRPDRGQVLTRFRGPPRRRFRDRSSTEAEDASAAL